MERTLLNGSCATVMQLGNPPTPATHTHIISSDSEYLQRSPTAETDNVG